MLKPLFVESENVLVHSFRNEELHRYDQLVAEIFDLLSDDDTLQFIPEKRLNSTEQAENWLKTSILNYHCGHNYMHLISEKKSGRLLGMVDILPPATAKAHYKLERYPYFIEFYLKTEFRGSGLMTHLLPVLMAEIAQQDIKELAAVVNRHNHAACNVLSNAGFALVSAFDHKQDLYHRLLDKGVSVMRRAG